MAARRTGNKRSKRFETQADATSPATQDTEDAPRYCVSELITESGESPFRSWLEGLKDFIARARIEARLTRIIDGGNLGDHRERISGAISELRIDYGLGYRIYYVSHDQIHDQIIVILIAGGTKDSQQSNIETAAKLWEKGKSDVERFSRNIIP